MINLTGWCTIHPSTHPSNQSLLITTFSITIRPSTLLNPPFFHPSRSVHFPLIISFSITFHNACITPSSFSHPVIHPSTHQFRRPRLSNIPFINKPLRHQSVHVFSLFTSFCSSSFYQPCTRLLIIYPSLHPSRIPRLPLFSSICASIFPLHQLHHHSINHIPIHPLFIHPSIHLVSP